MYRMRLSLAAGVLAVLGASCGDTTDTPANQVNLDRPVDISFACYGGLRLTEGGPVTPDNQDNVTISAQPLDACKIRSGDHASGDPAPVPPGQEAVTGGAPLPVVNWYGFILQSAPGTVALAQFATKPSASFASGDQLAVALIDADPLTPGTNGISVGEDPIAIATDKVGCFEVTANAGSCDLSALDIASALDTSDPEVLVNRIAVTNAAGQPILARPAAMVAEPPGGVIGTACTATPQGLVYIAYPGCHLVAGVDVATGKIVKGIDYSSGTPTLTDGNVSCPAECGAGVAPTTGIRPIALDLRKDDRTDAVKLAIGAENSASITIVELGLDALPQSLRQISFEDTTGKLGFSSVALTPQIGMGGKAGFIDDDLTSNQFQFVYGVANDRSVRVADVFALNRECDAQVDPRVIDTVTSVQTLSCFKVGDPATPRRRPQARTPGIELPHDSVPTSVAIFRAANYDGQQVTPPFTLIGYYGMITASDGRTFVFNVDDDNYPDFKEQSAPLAVWMPLAIAHQLRDALQSRDLRITNTQDDGMGHTTTTTLCDDLGPDPDPSTGATVAGGPRATGAPTRTVPTGAFAAEKVGELPVIRQVQCTGTDETRPVSELAFAAPDAVRDLEYPDLTALREETWTMTWEGALSLDKSGADVDGPPIRIGQMVVDNAGFRMTDPAKPFCDAGVEQYDILQLRGCDPSLGDGECPVGYTCFVHPNSQVAGLGACMLSTEADRLADACKDFLTSLRRYTVNRTESGLVTLLPRKHVLTTTPVDGCTDDNQCQALADLALQNTVATQPGDATNTDSHSYVCAVDNDRTPLNGAGQTGKRCIESCTQTSDCTTGRICQAGYCMEGVEPPQACVNGPQRYDLRAGDAFALVGSASGFVHPTILDTATGKCVKNPAASPFDVGRIPLAPPACDPSADPRTGLLPSGVYDANPCSLTVDHTELAPKYVAGTCTLADPATELVTRQAPAVRIHTRGPTLTLVDPYYPGDQSCIRDRAGNLGKIPLTFPGYQLSWRQAGGFAPMTLGIAPSYPVKVVRGPTESIWVIDEGDFLSTTVTLPSTRGKVYRIEIQGLGQINTLE